MLLLNHKSDQHRLESVIKMDRYGWSTCVGIRTYI